MPIVSLDSTGQMVVEKILYNVRLEYLFYFSITDVVLHLNKSENSFTEKGFVPRVVETDKLKMFITTTMTKNGQMTIKVRLR